MKAKNINYKSDKKLLTSGLLLYLEFDNLGKKNLEFDNFCKKPSVLKINH